MPIRSRPGRPSPGIREARRCIDSELNLVRIQIMISLGLSNIWYIGAGIVVLTCLITGLLVYKRGKSKSG